MISDGIAGLTTVVSPSGNQILYTEIKGNAWKMYIYNQKEKFTVPLPFATLPEKCLWSKNELMLYCGRPRAQSPNAPDDWYQGLTSFDDELWKFDFKTSIPTRLSDLTPAPGQTLDLINPHASEDEQYLVFTNKKDFSFWAIPLNVSQ